MNFKINIFNVIENVNIHIFLFAFSSIVINPSSIHAQDHEALRIFNWPHDLDTLIWNETILPGSITWKINGEDFFTAYTLTENKIIPHWTNTFDPTDTIHLYFKVLPYPFHQRISLWDSTQIKIVEGDFLFDPAIAPQRNALIESSGLDYDGALTRGFSLGNNQSLVFDSELNLQLHGKIGDGYEVSAAITDNNLPIQADGTTRQIREFDKVFIQIQKDHHSILAGDFDAAHSPGYFMRYQRKLKGAQYAYDALRTDAPLSVQGSAAVARGKFTRQNIIPIEGNQGPYPLRGENGELFIIVLAGSETVYLDGVLLIRGEDADYIMDYNQSEIIFTRNILINARHRITIEFEYAQFNYQKILNTLEFKYQKNKLNSFFYFYQENDSKSITGDLALTAEDLHVLAQAGDQAQSFSRSGIRESPEGFSSNLILYRTSDTLVNSVVYPNILTWSTDPAQAKWIVTFSEVGSGRGDYIISPDPSPNGRVYIWIAPDEVTGQSRGNFAPIIPLYAPQQRQMITTGVDYSLGGKGVVSMEAGLSRQDLNRYSDLDDEDNTGLALKIIYMDALPLGKSWILAPALRFETNDNQFIPLDPYRNPEFARDWSLQASEIYSGGYLPSAGLKLSRGRAITGLYQYDGLVQQGQYRGNRHSAQIGFDTLGWKLDARLSRLDAKDNLFTSDFIRPTLTLERVLRASGDWRLGIKHFFEKNETRHVMTDSLSMTSFIENEFMIYVKNHQDSDMHIQLSYLRERPQLPVSNRLVRSERTQEWSLTGHLHQWKNIKLDYTLKHRDVVPEPGSLAPGGQNLLGRMDIRTDIINKAFRWTAGYEIGNGQEPKQEYKYVKVRQGEGIYIWVDNGNGIEEINEFEIAPFSDQGEYIRLSVFNNEFIRTRSLGLLQTIHLDGKQLRQRGWISRVSGLSSYQLTRRTREDADIPYWNPFYTSHPDTSILGFADTWRNIIYWNRSSPAYDFQLGHVRQHFQSLQTSGYEAKESEDFTVRARMNLRKKMDLVLNFRDGTRMHRSQFFQNKTFTLQQVETGPELNVVVQDKWRVTGSYQYLYQKNISGPERFNSHKLSMEGVWRMNKRTDLRSHVSMVRIDYASFGNMNIDFAMLQGLRDGVNVLWSGQWNIRLNASLILTLQYNGRKTGDIRTVHTGSAQVRANF